MTKQQYIILCTFYICIYNGIPLSHYKRTKFFHVGELGKHYAKKSDKEQILYDITHMWNPEDTAN